MEDIQRCNRVNNDNSTVIILHYEWGNGHDKRPHDKLYEL